MNYSCNPNTTFNMTSRRFHLSKDPQLQIKFNFFFKSDYLNIFETQDSTPQLFRQYLPSSTDNTTATVDVEESLSFEDMVEAVVDAVGHRLVEEDLVALVDLAWLEVNRSFPTQTLPMFTVLHLRFDIRIEHLHVWAVDSSSFKLLEKYEVDRVKEGEERCCCICLEELRGGVDGGGALRMPCSHVFHGDCIKKWLTTSHSCPLCRYKMSTQ